MACLGVLPLECGRGEALADQSPQNHTRGVLWGHSLARMNATWAALIAAGAAVMASATTGWFTTFAARTQARATQETQLAQLQHARVEARHQQRRQAYADFVKAVGILNTKLADLASVAGSETAFDETLREARSERASLMSAAHVAFLEGPAAVGERVRDLHNCVDRYWVAVGRLHDAACTGDDDAARDSREHMILVRANTRRLRDLFVEAARGALESV